MLDFQRLTPINDVDKGHANDPGSVRAYYEEALAFLLSHAWCRSVKRSYLGMGYEGILGVFLFEIIPSQEGVDEFLWVITGDIPPAYLVCDDSPTAADALQAYVEEMRLWVQAVRSGAPTADIIPVNAPETEEYTSMLESRLRFIERELLSQQDLPP